MCHSDAGSQFTSLRYGERLVELGAVPSIGSIGDSYDNALATLGWVTWFNTSRLHSTLSDLPPVEYEAAYHHELETSQPVGTH